MERENDVKERVVAEELLHAYVALDSGFFDPIGIDGYSVDFLITFGFKILDEEIRGIIRDGIEGVVTEEKKLLNYV